MRSLCSLFRGFCLHFIPPFFQHFLGEILDPRGAGTNRKKTQKSAKTWWNVMAPSHAILAESQRNKPPKHVHNVSETRQ